ncbi:lysophospholipid acyltransferase family protein [soil metagenome]
MSEPVDPRTGLPLYPFKRVLPFPIYWPYRIIRSALVGSCFAAFWGGSVIMCWLMLPFMLLWPGTRADKMHRVQRCVRGGFKLFHLTMRVMWLYHRVSSSRTLRPNGAPADSPAVVIANHPSLCDVTSIGSLFPNIVAVARPSLANNPLLRPLVKWCGFIPVGTHMLQDAEERLRMGFDVMIFPEGTCSPRDGSLHPFQRGAIELAARAKVPLVLLKLTCSPPALSKGLPIWKHPDRIAMLTIEPFDMIYPADQELGSKALCRVIEQRYRELMGYPSRAELGGIQ